LREPIHPALPYGRAEILWAVRQEMARTVEDIMARRTRALLLDTRASIQAAPTVARLVREELGHGETWPQETVAEYVAIARRYLLD
jgi:glycerol-3-phosphate dehydrogenase